MKLSTKSLLVAAQMVFATMVPAEAQPLEGETYIINPFNFVDDNGSFVQNHFTIEAAKKAALGNKYNRFAETGSEFLFLNNPCEDDFNYSLYMTDRRFRHLTSDDKSTDQSEKILAQVTAIELLDKQPFDMDAVYDANNPSPETIEDRLLTKLYAELGTFSYKRTAECEPMPLGIIFQSGEYKPFERNDAGTPLVRTRFHDADVIAATRVTFEQAKARGDEKLAAKGVPNSFNSLDGAVTAAMRIPSVTIIMTDMQAIYIYRGADNRDVPGFGRQFKNLDEYVTALKKAKPDNGMTILAMVAGDKGVALISTPAQ